MKIKLTVSYDGTNYCGWQVQPNGVTVQEKLEQAIFNLTGETVRVTGSGRTDAGVHAKGQVAHFSVQKATVPPEKYYLALNPLLPDDIKVLSSALAEEDFHACTTAKRKTYSYSLYVSQVALPLKERYALGLDKAPDIDKMKEVASVFIGEHDFKGFCASGSGAKTTVRTIYSIDTIESNGYITVSVTGNGFLYNMVRILTGTLLKAGYGEIDVQAAKKMLSTGERTLGGKTLLAKGLCLEKVEY